MGTSTLITNARIFDGEETITEHGYIFLEDGLISKIGPVNASSVPSADICVNASGHTILPGLIDAHVHVHKGSVELAQALRFGVTTVLDLFNEPDHIEKLKREAANRTDIADVKSACFAATIPGGWPRPVVLATTDDKKAAEERIAKWPELESPDQAEGFVVDMKSRGADFIKLMHESGEGLLGNPLPLPSYDLQRALIQAAHSHGLITLAHALTQKDTLAILAAGTDGLAHSFCDEAPKDELLNAYRKNNSFLIPTLVVSATLTGAETENTEQFAGHPLFSKVLNDNDKACYCSRAMMAKKSCKSDYSYQTVRMLHEGGIDIVAGTDAATGLPGTAIGLSLHQELCLYVERCGLTPLEALRSATSVTARRFGLEDRGKLTKGKRADLLMVKGNPTVDIGCTLDVKGVWRSGISTSIQDTMV